MRICIAGCPTLGIPVYKFPPETDPASRDLWFGKFGLHSGLYANKTVYICRRHFSAVMTFGRSLRYNNAYPDVNLRKYNEHMPYTEQYSEYYRDGNPPPGEYNVKAISECTEKETPTIKNAAHEIPVTELSDTEVAEITLSQTEDELSPSKDLEIVESSVQTYVPYQKRQCVLKCPGRRKFHILPSIETKLERRKKWLYLLAKDPDLYQSKYHYVCDLHFDATLPPPLQKSIQENLEAKTECFQKCTDYKRKYRFPSVQTEGERLKAFFMDEATLNVLPTSGPVQSPEEIAKRIQSRFPASISVCVKTSVGAEDINNGSQRTANVTIEPTVVKLTTSVSATTTASSGSSAIGALCTPNSSATNISTTTRTNININNSTLCTPRDSTPSSTIALPAAAPRTQLTTNKIIKVANIKTIKRLNKFALHYPPSIASSAIKSIAIRKAKSTVPPVNLLARNCLLLPPKNPLSNSKAQVTSIKCLPRFTESNTAESNASPCCKLQTSTMVAIPADNKPDLQEKPPDSSRYSFDNLTMLTHAEKPQHTAAASMPNFSYSYLRSLSAYMREAKAYYAKASKTCNTECGKDPLALDGINKQKQQLVAAGSSTQCQGGEKEECDAVKQLQANNENVIDLEDPLSLDAIPADISKEKQQLVGQDAEAHCQEDEKKKSDAIRQLKVGAETTVDLEDIETDLVTYEIFNNGRDNVDGSSRNECTQTNESTMEVLSKISVLRETVKQQAEELVSLKAAMRFLNTKIDIENVSPVES